MHDCQQLSILTFLTLKRLWVLDTVPNDINNGMVDTDHDVILVHLDSNHDIYDMLYTIRCHCHRDILPSLSSHVDGGILGVLRSM